LQLLVPRLLSGKWGGLRSPTGAAREEDSKSEGGNTYGYNTHRGKQGQNDRKMEG